jgi:hypothetical protein
LAKNLVFFKTEDDVPDPVGKLHEKNMKRNIFFTVLKSLKKEAGSGVGSGSGS